MNFAASLKNGNHGAPFHPILDQMDAITPMFLFTLRSTNGLADPIGTSPSLERNQTLIGGR
jgi:hypothetical protein